MEKDTLVVSQLKAKSPSQYTPISEYVAQERLLSNPVDLKTNKTEKVNVSQLDDSSKAKSSFYSPRGFLLQLRFRCVLFC